MQYLRDSHPHRLGRMMVLPVIMSLVVPIIVMDIWVELYHRTAFPFYNLPYIRRGDYIKIDRQKLPYLNIAQKFYCVYCGYANGLFAYWVAIGAATEKYWCGIQHDTREGFHAPSHHGDFAVYGDEEEFCKLYKDKA